MITSILKMVFKICNAKIIALSLHIDDGSTQAMAETVFGVFMICAEGAEPDDEPENSGVRLEGVEVLRELRSVAFAVAVLFGFVYALNLNYPQELKYTFEALQKILMGLDESKLSNKVQVLNTLLFCNKKLLPLFGLTCHAFIYILLLFKVCYVGVKYCWTVFMLRKSTVSTLYSCFLGR